MIIRKEYKVRPSMKGKKGPRGKEITLPPEWCDYHDVELGDVVEVLAESIVVILPPSVSDETVEKVRNFLEGGSVDEPK